MTVHMPDDGQSSSVPSQSARIIRIEPNLANDFFQGDPIRLDVTLNRPLTALELRVLDERGPEGWTTLGHFIAVEVMRVSQATLGQIQAVLDETNTTAAERAREASTTRSLLTQLIEQWDL